MNSTLLLEARDLKKFYPVRRLFKSAATVKALDGVSFQLARKETLAVVGESGCGKSTLAKLLMRIEPATDGEVLIEGENALQLKGAEYYKSIQMIFQDPYSSVNPRKKAWQIISEPLQINSDLSMKECRNRAIETMAKVGLRPEYADRYPHMFSGGQRQRIGVARALILRPKIMICDEPVSALDVSIQAQVINLLIELQDQFDLSYVFISHDLSVVRHISDRVMVMYLGKVVEYGTRDQIFKFPQHPYTRALLASTPKIHKRKPETDPSHFHALRGELPSPLNPPPGCTFHKRCPMAQEICRKDVPALRIVRGREVACHFAEEIGV